jgi:hypothetical protein
VCSLELSFTGGCQAEMQDLAGTGQMTLKKYASLLLFSYLLLSARAKWNMSLNWMFQGK